MIENIARIVLAGSLMFGSAHLPLSSTSPTVSALIKAVSIGQAQGL